MKHRRRPTYLLPEDDGLVPIPYRGGPRLVTPEQAHIRAKSIMEGFDDLPQYQRDAWNYAHRIDNKSASTSIKYVRPTRRVIKEMKRVSIEVEMEGF
jgi:hypothetical protein